MKHNYPQSYYQGVHVRKSMILIADNNNNKKVF